MNILFLAGIAFATLTRLDGSPVYIVPDMVTEVTASFGMMCPKPTHTFVRTLSSTYCVLETPEEAVRLLRALPTSREQQRDIK